MVTFPQGSVVDFEVSEGEGLVYAGSPLLMNSDRCLKKKIEALIGSPLNQLYL